MKIQNKDVLKPIFYFTTHLYYQYILYLNFTSTDIYSVVTSFTPVCRDFQIAANIWDQK